MTDDSDDGLITFKEVAAITGLTRSSCYWHMSRGNFPQQVQLLAGRGCGVAGCSCGG